MRQGIGPGSYHISYVDRMVHNDSQCHVNRTCDVQSWQTSLQSASWCLCFHLRLGQRRSARSMLVFFWSAQGKAANLWWAPENSHSKHPLLPFPSAKKSNHPEIHWYWIALSHITRNMSISQWLPACLTISTPELVPKMVSLVMVIQWLKTIESNWASCAYVRLYAEGWATPPKKIMQTSCKSEPYPTNSYHII